MESFSTSIALSCSNISGRFGWCDEYECNTCFSSGHKVAPFKANLQPGQAKKNKNKSCSALILKSLFYAGVSESDLWKHKWWIKRLKCNTVKAEQPCLLCRNSPNKLSKASLTSPSALASAFTPHPATFILQVKVCSHCKKIQFPPSWLEKGCASGQAVKHTSLIRLGHF